VDNGSERLVALLLEHGANPTIRGWMWLTARDKAESRLNDGQEVSRRIYEMVKRASVG
jgi:hypothetical protein